MSVVSASAFWHVCICMFLFCVRVVFFLVVEMETCLPSLRGEKRKGWARARRWQGEKKKKALLTSVSPRKSTAAEPAGSLPSPPRAL